MKINKSILVAALGLASVAAASATQYIYITGSTAARAAVYSTLAAGVGFDAAPRVASFGDASAANGSYQLYSNTIAGTPTIVKASWSGSEAGIRDVSGAVNESFLDDSKIGAGTVPGKALSDTGALVSQPVDLALADNAILYSQTPGSTAVQQGPVVVVPFVFVKNKTTIANQAAFSNLTSDQFKQLAAGGDWLALFTGNPADQNNWVYLTGRDINSGTRCNVFAETGWGINHSPNQVVLSGGSIVGNAYAAGTAGQSSGGTLAKSLVDTTTSDDNLQGNGNSAGFIAVTYLGLADDANAEAAPYNAVRLTYNGVAYSTANVQNGLYPIWGNEYVLNKAGSSALVTTLAGKLANTATGISAHTGDYEISLSSMHVNRSLSNGPLQVPHY